ncbi:hypothetical protein JZ751_009939 [Albula glossodonta]|uniref:Ephrin RBD domain-containing protein n=1 Tax=Albula glossodonta TaxID=121402 RepID=A0A8T2P711_9TELE|nr:hypothetical protein JZ751_009939 [Albula glossodonta]
MSFGRDHSGPAPPEFQSCNWSGDSSQAGASKSVGAYTRREQASAHDALLTPTDFQIEPSSSLSYIIISLWGRGVFLAVGLTTHQQLVQGDLSIRVNLSDYLDIYCPHYPPGTPSSGTPETLALYLVAEGEFQGCVETRGAIKRWECNSPYAPYGPVRFSEKIQRFTPFSLGFEFLPGHRYYYSCLCLSCSVSPVLPLSLSPMPTEEGPPLTCLKLRITVCCESSEYTPLFTLCPDPTTALHPSGILSFSPHESLCCVKPDKLTVCRESSGTPCFSSHPDPSIHSSLHGFSQDGPSPPASSLLLAHAPLAKLILTKLRDSPPFRLAPIPPPSPSPTPPSLFLVFCRS